MTELFLTIGGAKAKIEGALITQGDYRGLRDRIKKPDTFTLIVGGKRITGDFELLFSVDLTKEFSALSVIEPMTIDTTNLRCEILN